MKFIRTTLVGGLLFLTPFILLLIILSKAYQLLLQVAKPLGNLIPLDNLAGVALADILVVLLILSICFIAGLFARQKIMEKLREGIESRLLVKIPGYAMVKGFTESLKSTEEASENFIPVLVTFDDNEQLCFEIERTPDNKVVVYLPGAPSPWSGSVLYVEPSRVRKLGISVPEAVKNLQRIGLGTGDLLTR
ncbi:DUF502 domain-containing protein [Robiginitalea sp. SC105]|nr:DUF502 domain-containing protein [Robiginitalea sp. SC105]